jgi:hypothetical protein
VESAVDEAGTPRARGALVRATTALGSILLASLAAAAFACGGGGDAAVDAGPFLDAGAGDFRVDRVGQINLIEGGGFLGVYALLQDGPELPVPIVEAQSGPCTVFHRPAPALCQPACSGGVCTAPGVCTPWPSNASAGTITVTGLRAPLSFVPGAFGYVPQPEPGGDLFEAGATVGISAPGDVTPGFAVSLVAPAALEAPFQNLTLVDGVDATITWTPAGGGARSIQVALVVGWHGAPLEAMLLCETDDTGALVIPGAMVARLPRATSGLEQHLSWIQRFDRATVAAPAGPVEIVVASQVPLYIIRSGSPAAPTSSPSSTAAH